MAQALVVLPCSEPVCKPSHACILATCLMQPSRAAGLPGHSVWRAGPLGLAEFNHNFVLMRASLRAHMRAHVHDLWLMTHEPWVLTCVLATP